MFNLTFISDRRESVPAKILWKKKKQADISFHFFSHLSRQASINIIIQPYLLSFWAHSYTFDISFIVKILSSNIWYFDINSQRHILWRIISSNQICREMSQFDQRLQQLCQKYLCYISENCVCKYFWFWNSHYPDTCRVSTNLFNYRKFMSIRGVWDASCVNRNYTSTCMYRLASYFMHQCKNTSAD